MEPNFELPDDISPTGPWRSAPPMTDDPALPALEILRDTGLADAFPELRLGDIPPDLRLCNYVPGSRATFEIRAGDRRFAVKMYVDDPSSEVQLYRKLARLGLSKDFGARAPRLLAWDPELKMIVTSWLDGPTVAHLVKEGHGARGGTLAAQWLWHATRRRVRLGPPRGRTHALYQAGLAAGALSAVDSNLGAAAKAVAKVLVQTKIREQSPNLVHGTLYARHIFDLGDGPGVIDWQQFGQGPVEVDAGMFLATISRIGLRQESVAREATRAKEVFLEKTEHLLDLHALSWYWAAGLLHRAASGLRTGRKEKPSADAEALVEEAAAHARAAERDRSGDAKEPRSSLVRIRSLFHRPVALDPAKPGDVVSPAPESSGDRRD